jgi:hypothetical protein
VQGGKSTYNWLDGLVTSSCCANALALLSSRLEIQCTGAFVIIQCKPRIKHTGNSVSHIFGFHNRTFGDITSPTFNILRQVSCAEL